MQSFNAGSSLLFPVTPIIVLSKYFANFSIFYGLSLSGSTDTNTDSMSKYLAYGDFRTFYNALASFIKEFGQISGQLQKPKYIK